MHHGRRNLAPQPRGQGTVQIGLFGQTMQNQRHIRPTQIGPIGDITRERTGQIRGRKCGQRVIAGPDRHQRIQPDGADAKGRITGRGDHEFGPARRERFMGGGGVQRFKTEFCQNLISRRVTQPRRRVRAGGQDQVKTLMLGKACNQPRHQRRPSLRRADDPDHGLWRRQIRAGRAITNHPLGINGQQTIGAVDAVELTVIALQKTGNRQRPIA